MSLTSNVNGKKLIVVQIINVDKGFHKHEIKYKIMVHQKISKKWRINLRVLLVQVFVDNYFECEIQQSLPVSERNQIHLS